MFREIGWYHIEESIENWLISDELSNNLIPLEMVLNYCLNVCFPGIFTAELLFSIQKGIDIFYHSRVGSCITGQAFQNFF